MEAHFLVIINSKGKCRLCTIPLNAKNDGITSGLPQGLGDPSMASKPINNIISVVEGKESTCDAVISSASRPAA